MCDSLNSLREASQKIQQLYLIDFMKTEIVSEDVRQDILEFVSNWSIRTGEYECNVYVIHKLDRKNIIVYADEQWGEWGEDDMRNRLISRCIPIHTVDFIKEIKAYCI